MVECLINEFQIFATTLILNIWKTKARTIYKVFEAYDFLNEELSSQTFYLSFCIFQEMQKRLADKYLFYTKTEF